MNALFVPSGPRSWYAGALFTALAWIGLLVRRRDLPLLSGGRTT